MILTQCFHIIILSSILFILGARIFKLYHLYPYLTNILYHNKYINTFVKPIYMHTGSFWIWYCSKMYEIIVITPSPKDQYWVKYSFFRMYTVCLLLIIILMKFYAPTTIFQRWIKHTNVTRDRVLNSTYSLEIRYEILCFII